MPMMYTFIHMMRYCYLLLLISAIASCSKPTTTNNYQTVYQSFAAKTQLIELIGNEGKARLMITPAYQGRVITTTYHGQEGQPNGWYDKNLLQPKVENMSGLGGEDRLWIGPLGSQFSFFFQQTEPLSEDNWQVPAPMEAEPYELVSFNKQAAHMQKTMRLTNFKGTTFHLKIDRNIRLLSATDIQQLLSLHLDTGMAYVAFESKNTLENLNEEKLSKATGLASLWSAGMYEGSAKSVVIIPATQPLNISDLYRYLGPLDNRRLQLKGQTVLFKADGQYRSKIGVPPHLAPPIYGCYNPERQRLTIVQYQQTNDGLYCNSAVTVQEDPYQGESIPIYNHGTMDYSPTDEVSFYELESTSAMRELMPGEKLSHYHRVYHFNGSTDMLDNVSKQLLGISLADCSMD